jgi:hypothetical protein
MAACCLHSSLGLPTEWQELWLLLNGKFHDADLITIAVTCGGKTCDADLFKAYLSTRQGSMVLQIAKLINFPFW